MSPLESIMLALLSLGVGIVLFFGFGALVIWLLSEPGDWY